MSLITNAQLLERIHTLITHKRTGTPKQFAQKVDISERKLFRILEELKDLGAEIGYDSSRPSYFYKNTVDLRFSLTIRDGDDNVGQNKI